MKTLLAILAACNASIELSPPIQPTREYDSHIMDDVHLLGLKKMELIRFNRCRIFLHITTLSDACTTDGLSITSDAWTGVRTNCRISLFANQGNPDPKSWRIWRRILARLYLLEGPKYTVRSKTLLLTIPLTHWHGPALLDNQTWSYYYDPVDSSVYHSIYRDETFILHRHHPQPHRLGRQRLEYPSPPTPVTHYPHGSIPITPLQRQHGFALNVPPILRSTLLLTLPPLPLGLLIFSPFLSGNVNY